MLSLSLGCVFWVLESWILFHKIAIVVIEIMVITIRIVIIVTRGSGLSFCDRFFARASGCHSWNAPKLPDLLASREQDNTFSRSYMGRPIVPTNHHKLTTKFERLMP